MRMVIYLQMEELLVIYCMYMALTLLGRQTDRHTAKPLVQNLILSRLISLLKS